MTRRILFVASEAAPAIKVGGLADVVGALPVALRQLGHDVRVLLPKYEALPPGQLAQTKAVASTTIPWQGRSITVSVETTTLLGTSVPMYLLDAPDMFAGKEIYFEHGGDMSPRLAEERFIFFSWAVSHILPHLGWSPEVVHCHDWHTGLVPALLSLSATRPATIFTIHNMEGQGKWRAEEVWRWLGLHGHESPHLEYRDLENNLNLLQLGIRGADAVNTVSPTYAREILAANYGAGLDTDLRLRPGGVSGILNGIDVSRFDPATDLALAQRYDRGSADTGKRLNRGALAKEVGLRPSPGPLFGLVGRLTGQKGVDLVAQVIPDIVRGGGQVVILGSGQPEVEAAIVAAAASYREDCRALIRFDAAVAQRIYAASDFFLMPSRFEPCGLGQMIAMRYGAIPIVRDTGGLHDTVRDIVRSSAGTGFVFPHPTVGELRQAMSAALRLFAERDTLSAVRRRAMSEDFSWQRSAQVYEQLYDHAINTN